MTDASLDATVSEFLELEAELDSGTRRTTTYDEGLIAQVAKVSADTVPEEYPVPIETRHALQIGVEVETGDVISTYIEWPEDDEKSDHVEQLLDALGRSPDEFANIYGDRVALDNEDGWHGIHIQDTASIHAGRLASDESLELTRNLLIGTVAAGVVGFPLTGEYSSSLGAFLVLLSWVAIPALIYFDAKRIEEAPGWSPATTRWVVGGLIPIVNATVGMAYLVDRHVRLSGVTSGDISETWYRAIIASMVLTVLGLSILSVFPAIGTATFLYSGLFLPFAVYFDAEYVEDATDWDPSEELWAAGALFFGILGAIAYLFRRHGEVD